MKKINSNVIVNINEITEEKYSWKQLFVFIMFYLLILAIRQYSLSEIDNSFQSQALLNIVSNLTLIGISVFFIKTNKLMGIAGLSGSFFNKIGLTVFPLVYLVSLNLIFSDTINKENFFLNFSILTIYALTIGFAEELTIRGFMQSFLIKKIGHSKKNVFWAIVLTSLFFGLLHFIKFNNGVYGEIAQVLYASFIGFMFGAILLVTKSMYPLVIVHTMVDFASKLDSMGISVTENATKETPFINNILTVVLVLPCLLYGFFVFKKIKSY